MIKRILTFILAAALMSSVFLFAGCHSSESTPEETDEIKEGFDLADGKETEIGAVLEKLGLEYGMIDASLSDKSILTLFEKELEKGKAEGYTPVILVNDSVICRDIEYMLENGYDVQSELQNELPDAEAYLQERIDDLERMLGTSLDEAKGMGGMGLAASQGFTATASASMFGIVPEIALVKLPTDKPWEAAIYIPFGGWNECPAPLEMAAVLKLWYEKYGAVPAAISHDILDMVSSAELSNDDALTVARQMIAFDNDLLFMGVSANKLANSIKRSKVWSFWWD